MAYIKAHIETGISKLHFFVMRIQEAAEVDSKPLMSHPSSLDSILNKDTFVIQKSRDITEGLCFACQTVFILFMILYTLLFNTQFLVYCRRQEGSEKVN